MGRALQRLGGLAMSVALGLRCRRARPARRIRWRAEPIKQIKLTEEQVTKFISAQPDLGEISGKLQEAGENPDAALQGELDGIAKKHGFASFSELDDVAANISIVMAGLDAQGDLHRSRRRAQEGARGRKGRYLHSAGGQGQADHRADRGYQDDAAAGAQGKCRSGEGASGGDRESAAVAPRFAPEDATMVMQERIAGRGAGRRSPAAHRLAAAGRGGSDHEPRRRRATACRWP